MAIPEPSIKLNPWQTFLSAQGIALGYVMDIEVPWQELEARVVNRRYSNNACGAIYNLNSKPPKRKVSAICAAVR